MARKPVAPSYPSFAIAGASSDPAAQALAHLANARALASLEARPPEELESPGARFTATVMGKVGEAVGDLINQKVQGSGGNPSQGGLVEDHLKLSKDSREQYGDLIERQKDLIAGYESKIADLKEQLAGAYQSGYREADEKWSMRMELSDRTNARLDEIQTTLQHRDLEEKDKQIESRDQQITRLLDELRAERESLRAAHERVSELQVLKIKNEHEMEKLDLMHQLERAKSQVPQAKTPEQIYQEAWARAEALKAEEMARLAIEKQRQDIEDSHSESESRAKVYETLGSALQGVAEKAPDLIGAFIGGSAPSRGYGPQGSPSVRVLRTGESA